MKKLGIEKVHKWPPKCEICKGFQSHQFPIIWYIPTLSWCVLKQLMVYAHDYAHVVYVQIVTI